MPTVPVSSALWPLSGVAWGARKGLVERVPAWTDVIGDSQTWVRDQRPGELPDLE